MAINRGRLIIGERPAPDVVQCLRCRRKWDARLHRGTKCIVCKIDWGSYPEWDQASLMRKLWMIESRWRMGFGYGRWQQIAQLPGSHSSDEIESILDQYRLIEKRRCARLKYALKFEYQAAELFVEVYRGFVA